MILKKICVGRYGKLNDLQIELKEGLNIIYGENEAGKSTLQSFIKAMFYGLHSQKKSIRENDRKRFLPWSGEDAYGEIFFEDDYNNEYMIKRRFGQRKKDDRVDILDVVTGQEIGHIHKDKPGEDVFGLGEEAFEKTLFIRQLMCEITRDKEDEVIKKLTNLKCSGDEDVSYHKALDNLESAKKRLKSTRKIGEIDKLKDYHAGLQEQWMEGIRLQEENIEDQIKLNDKEKEKSILGNSILKLEEQRKQHKKFNSFKEYKELMGYRNKITHLSEEKEKIIHALTCGDHCIDEAFIEQVKEKYISFIHEKEQYDEIMMKKEKIEEAKKEKEYLESLHLELKHEKISLGKWNNFESMDENLETKIYELEEKIKALKLRNDDGKKDQMLLRRDILKDKYKGAGIGILIGVFMIVLGFLGGLFQTIYLYGVSVLGFLFSIYALSKRKNIALGIDDIEKEIASYKDTKSLEEAVNELNKIYKSLDVLNYQEFRIGMKRYAEKKEKIAVLKIKIEEKNKQIEKELDETNNKLKRVEENLGIFKNEIIEKLQFFNTTPIKINEALNIINKLKERLEEKNEIERQIFSLQDVYNALLQDKDIEKLKEEFNDFYVSEEDEKIDSEEIENLLKKENKRFVDVEKEIKDIEHRIATRFYGRKNIVEIEEEMDRIKEKIKDYEENYVSLNMASEILIDSFKEMQRSFGPKLNKIVGDILSTITKDKYKELKISEDYEVKIIDPIENEVKDAQYYSNGTWDQIYFALRIGIIHLIFEQGNNMPLVLDDAFIQYDDTRLASVLKYLQEYAKNHQVIVFTCQKREIDSCHLFSDVHVIHL